MARKQKTVKKTAQTITAADVQSLDVNEILQPERDRDLERDCLKDVSDSEREMSGVLLNDNPFSPETGPADVQNLLVCMVQELPLGKRPEINSLGFKAYLRGVSNFFIYLQKMKTEIWLNLKLQGKLFVPGLPPDAFQTLCSAAAPVDDKGRCVRTSPLERASFGKTLIARVAGPFEKDWYSDMEAFLIEKTLSYLTGVDSSISMVMVRQDLRKFLKPFCAPAQGEDFQVNKYDGETRMNKTVHYTRINGVLYRTDSHAVASIDRLRERIVLQMTDYAAIRHDKRLCGLEAVRYVENCGRPVALNIFANCKFTDKATGQRVEKVHACIYSARDKAIGVPSLETTHSDVKVERKTLQDRGEQDCSGLSGAKRLLMTAAAAMATRKRIETKLIVICVGGRVFELREDFLAKNPGYFEIFAEPVYYGHPVIAAIRRREFEEKQAEQQREQRQKSAQPRNPMTADALNALGALGSDFVSAPVDDATTVVDEADMALPMMEVFADLAEKLADADESEEK